MATTAQWIEGARPRTLPAAVSPVLAGTATAAFWHLENWWKAVLALLVALLLQVGVNYANDYSDGIRGTDADRVGPMRLVGSGASEARTVKLAAFACFALAAVAGLVLAVTTAWWLLLLGALSILAAWFYTGGSHPYGYYGLGEVMVFCFFGLVAVLGTTYVQVHGASFGWFAFAPAGDLGPPNSLWPAAWDAAAGVGALAAAILVANNLRDIPTDRAARKRTLAVLLGDSGTRAVYVLFSLLAVAMIIGFARLTTPVALVGLVALVPLVRSNLTVLRGHTGSALIPVLQQTGAAEVVYAAGMLIGVLVSR